jgi:hypothetical protein
VVSPERDRIYQTDSKCYLGFFGPADVNKSCTDTGRNARIPYTNDGDGKPEVFVSNKRDEIFECFQRLNLHVPTRWWPFSAASDMSLRISTFHLHCFCYKFN